MTQTDAPRSGFIRLRHRSGGAGGSGDANEHRQRRIRPCASRASPRVIPMPQTNARSDRSVRSRHGRRRAHRSYDANGSEGPQMHIFASREAGARAPDGIPSPAMTDPYVLVTRADTRAAPMPQTDARSDSPARSRHGTVSHMLPPANEHQRLRIRSFASPGDETRAAPMTKTHGRSDGSVRLRHEIGVQSVPVTQTHARGNESVRSRHRRRGAHALMTRTDARNDQSVRLRHGRRRPPLA